jgi:hypothetical protein
LLNRLGTRAFIPLWLVLILASAVILIRFVIAYRDGRKWWLGTTAILFVFVILPALLVGFSQVFYRFFEWLGLPAPLEWLMGMAGGELVTMGGYFLAAVSVLLGLGSMSNKAATPRAKFAAISASLISCAFIALYLHVASIPQLW